jgi:cobalt-zinc-cadmium efflux system protein
MSSTNKHTHNSSNLKNTFLIAISLNIFYALTELVSGLYFGSMSMISDAGHNFVDVFSLSIAYGGILLSGIKPNKKFTFGYKKSSILAAVLNSVFLIVAVFLIIKESINRIIDPVEVNGISMIVVAGIGIFINGFTGWMFHKEQHKDINVKAAFTHLLADAMISLGVVVSGIIIYLTGWTLIDPFFSIVIALVIMIMTFKILRNSVKMAVDGVPEGIDVEKIENEVTALEGVLGIHHVHIWGLSTSESALTAHIQVGSEVSLTDLELLKDSVRSLLMKFEIFHSTLEFEIPGEKCSNHCTSC